MNGFGQTLVSSVNLELKKPWDRRMVTSTVSKDGNSFFAFAADKRKTYALKYNQALFFRDSISGDRPSQDVDYIAGTSFDTSGNPYVHWFSDNHSKLVSNGFDFTQRRILSTSYDISYDKETFLNAFSANGDFFIVTVSDEDQKLFLRIFSDGKPEVHEVDLSKFEIVSQQGKKLKLFSFFEQFPLQYIEPSSFCPLSVSASIAKMYSQGNSLILSLDHDSKYTQLFEISLTDFSVKETRNNQPELSGVNPTKANSFLSDQGFFQIRVSPKEFSISFERSYEGASEPVVYNAKEQENITFKTSPLFIQNGSSKPSDLKNTAKFLRRLENCTPGISVYNSAQGLLLTCGGIRQTVNTGNAILAGTLGVGLIVAGGNPIDPSGLMDASTLQQVYFESAFDGNFKFLTGEQLPISTDFLSGFFAENDHITAYSISRFGKSDILSYYDSGKKAVVLRKFTDASDDDIFPE